MCRKEQLILWTEFCNLKLLQFAYETKSNTIKCNAVTVFDHKLGHCKVNEPENCKQNLPFLHFNVALCLWN